MSVSYAAGRYKVRVTDNGLTGTDKGTDMFFMELKVLKKLTETGAEEECPTEQRTFRRAIVEKTIKWLSDDLGSIGVTFESFSQLNPQNAKAVKIIGREIEMCCEHKTYQGKDIEQWDFPRQRGTKLSDDKVHQLDLRFGHLLPKPSTTPSPSVVRNESDETF